MRFVVLDSWRGLAALLIAALHFNVAAPGYDSALWRFAPLAVDFFFVLSGYVITSAYFGRLHTLRHAGGFLVRRFGRVWPLHAFVLACFVLVELLKLGAVAAGLPARTAPFADGGTTSLTLLMQHILLLHGTGLSDRLAWNAPSWTISAEFWVYGIFAAIGVLRPYAITTSLLALGFVAGCVVAFGIGAYDLDMTYDFGLARCLMGFAIGHAAYRLRSIGIQVRIGPTATIRELLILGVIGLAWIVTTGTHAILVMPVLFAIMIVVFTGEAGRVSHLLKKDSFQALGRWSYSIYMVHGLLLYIFSQAVTLAEAKLGLTLWQTMAHGGRMVPTVVPGHDIFGLCALVVYLAIVVALSSLTYRFIEAPARDYFNARGQAIAGPPGLPWIVTRQLSKVGLKSKKF